MIVQINQEHVEFEVLTTNKLEIIQRLYIDGPRVVVSNCFEKYQEVHLSTDTFGSKKFLDINDETDILTFHREMQNLAYLELGLQYKFSARFSDTSSPAGVKSELRMKNNLKKVLDSAERSDFSAIKEVIEGWIDDYY